MNKPYLAIHIRTGFLGMEQDEGEHFNSRKAFRNSTDWEKTVDCSIELADVLFGAEHPIYLATDSNLVKKLVVTEYGKRIKMANLTLQHVAFTMHKPGQAKRNEQQKHDYSFPEGSGDILSSPMEHGPLVNVSGIDGYMATWIDFLLMARASALVHSISGFSVNAGQFCSTRSQYYVPNCTQRPERR